MKNLTLFLLLFLCAATIRSQDIIHKTGSGGSFKIQDNNGVTDFVFSKNQIGDPEMQVGTNIRPLDDIVDVWMLNLQSDLLGPNISVAGFANDPPGPNFWFHRARNNANGTVKSVSNDDVLGTISFRAYTNDWLRMAEISSSITNVDNDLASANLQFRTRHENQDLVRMTITDQGKVVITDLVGSGTVNVQVDASGKLIRAASEPNKVHDAGIVEALQRENRALLQRVERLEAIVEQLQTK